MSRTQSSVPLKSKALRMPVPVITQTFLPSVTGDGDDIFCLRIFVLPALRCFFHSTSPLLRSTHQRERLSPSATFRKIRSPQIMGVAPVQLGIASFQVMFSSVLHLSGRFFSLLMPFREGPRHCGQLSAEADLIATRRARNAKRSPLRNVFPPKWNANNISSFREKEESQRAEGGGRQIRKAGHVVTNSFVMIIKRANQSERINSLLRGRNENE